ncbi:hypothetical protein [Streptomyces sp. NPDC021622]
MRDLAPDRHRDWLRPHHLLVGRRIVEDLAHHHPGDLYREQSVPDVQ